VLAILLTLKQLKKYLSFWIAMLADQMQMVSRWDGSCCLEKLVL